MSPRMTGATRRCEQGGKKVTEDEEKGRTVHEHRLGDVVRVVARDDMVDAERRRTAIERLAPKDAAEGAVVLAPDLRDDGVHRPAIEHVVAEDLEREAVLHLVALHRLPEDSD